MQPAWFAVLVAALGCAEAQQYRQPPGVNPAQYQQGVPQQQFQPPPPPQHVPQQQMQGQVPQQQMQGQVPQQQMQGQMPQQPQQGIPQQQFQPAPAAVPEQAVPQQGVPQQQFQRADGHAHGGHGQPQAMLRDKQQIAAEKDHIKEHLGAPIDTSGMSEQELQFHYFKMHDADGNDKLDGLELVASLQHWHDQSEAQPGQQQQAPQPKIFSDQELFELIDPIIDQDDRNRDGYIDYSEFMVAQQNAPPPPPASQGQQVA